MSLKFLLFLHDSIGGYGKHSLTSCMCGLFQYDLIEQIHSLMLVLFCSALYANSDIVFPLFAMIVEEDMHI